jgi:tetratricopeptide (TPR) repeat protein
MPRVLLFACAVLLALPLAAQQQDPSAPAPQQNSAAKHKKQDQQPAPPKKPSTAEQNPFPEAQSEAAARQAQQQPHDQTPAPSAPAPQNADAPKAKPSEADQNPFPEEQSRHAAQQANPGRQGQAPSGSGPGYSSSQTGLQGLDVPKSTDELRSIHSPSVGKKDTQVGLFYLKTGDYQGAYDRFAEATKVDPSNADAVFGLAESARHLNHRDEAIRNYQLYLSALPDGPRAKDARKGLKELGVKPAS